MDRNEKEIVRSTGYAFAQGFMAWIGTLFIIGLLLVFGYKLARNFLEAGMDDSDKSSWERSNLRIYTDYRTGVQYVESPNGLTLRVTSDGKPITKDQTK